MTWQQLKNLGEPIYFMRRSGGEYYLKKAYRVVYWSNSEKINTQRCVRYERRWYPLHEREELKIRYKCEVGTFARVYLNYRPMAASDEKLPFVRIWEEPGNLYHVYGY